MESWDIIGYSYDADIHCISCAEKQFPQLAENREAQPNDSESNPVHAIFASDEFEDNRCGDCGCDLIEN